MLTRTFGRLGVLFAADLYSSLFFSELRQWPSNAVLFCSLHVLYISQICADVPLRNYSLTPACALNKLILSKV